MSRASNNDTTHSNTTVDSSIRMKELQQSIATLKKQRDALEEEGMAIISELTNAPSSSSSTPLATTIHEYDDNTADDGTTATTSTTTVVASAMMMIPPPAGIDTPLVDAEGYPRSDIDIYRVRTLRQRLATIQYDRDTIQKQIAHLVQEIMTFHKTADVILHDHDELRARQAVKPKPKIDPVTGKWVVCNWDGTKAGIPNGHLRQFHHPLSLVLPPTDTTTASMSDNNNNNDNNRTSNDNNLGHNNRNNTIQQQQQHHHQLLQDWIPWARVNTVDHDSPAAKAGLQPNDLIVQFGPLKRPKAKPRVNVDSMNNTNNDEYDERHGILVSSSSSTTTTTTNTTTTPSVASLFEQVKDMVPQAAENRRSISLQVQRQTVQPPQQQQHLDGFATAADLATTTISADHYMEKNDDNNTMELISLMLFPQPWHGRGFLGCHLLPWDPN
jgi:hypothetical protein